jgi:hypothetical protein
MERQIKFICIACRWFDKVNGNTYHSVRVTRVKDNKTIVGAFQYGYGEDYKQTALKIMGKENWISEKYKKESYLYERENNYPIYWDCRDGLKRDCVSNGIL